MNLIFRHPEYSQEALIEVVTRHRAALKSGTKNALLKITPHRSMSLQKIHSASGEEEVFVKHFHPAEAGKKINQKLRGRSNAQVIYEIGQEFAARGMDTPAIIGVLQTGTGASAESFLVMSSVAHLPHLEDVLSYPNTELVRHYNLTRRQLLSALAREWRRLHDAGIYYAESHPRHMYFQIKNGEPHFTWIDYDGTQFLSHPLPYKSVVEHFYYFSFMYVHRRKHRQHGRRSEMLYFLREYSAGDKSNAEIKQMARDILSWNPPLSSRVKTKLRDSVRFVFRESERQQYFKRKKKNKKRKPPR